MNAYIFMSQRGWGGQVGEFEGCPIHPIHNGPSNWWRFMMNRNYSSPFVSSWHVDDLASSSALIWMFLASLFLDWGMLLHFFRLVICQVFVSHRNLSWTITRFDDPLGIGVLDMYGEFRRMVPSGMHFNLFCHLRDTCKSWLWQERYT